ncbi:MAG: thymidine phosphorylase [Bacillota bacterium]|jgi:pyrimidine-nucleoside phosphorylase
MNMIDIITKKRDKQELSYDDLKWWIDGYLTGEITDYQSSALLMAMYLNGLTDEETFDLTEIMMHSGQTIDLSGINGRKVDKHSTGGVGDKTTLVIAPVLAAAGLKVAKMSGRGLGHTGGTLDKLEAIPGFSVEKSTSDFIRQVNKEGLAVISQSAELVPADQKLYALRDVTATVDSTPLIAASIMSKKLATGADVIVLDVKYGSGAFMKTPEAAKELAEQMIRIGLRHGRMVAAVITSMESPLGFAVGNALEVDEAIDSLQGKGPMDLYLLVQVLAGEIIYQSGFKHMRRDAYTYVNELLESNKSWKKFLALVKAQGGDIGAVKEGHITKAEYTMEIGSVAEGYIRRVDALTIGCAARDLGAGRFTKEEEIDINAGIVVHKKVGNYVHIGDPIATVYCKDIYQATEVAAKIMRAFEIVPNEIQPEQLIYGIVDRDGFIPWSEVLKGI